MFCCHTGHTDTDSVILGTLSNTVIMDTLTCNVILYRKNKGKISSHFFLQSLKLNPYTILRHFCHDFFILCAFWVKI